MSKELEALKIGIPKLKKLYENNAKKMNKNDILGFDLTFVYLDKALQRLEAIDKKRCGANVEKVILDEFVPSNELEKEYLEDLDHYDEGMGIHSTSYEKCKERLIRLAKIDNANPSEALEFIKMLLDASGSEKHFINLANYDIRLNLNKTKQSLLKAQEQEKINAYVEKIKTMMKQKDCVLRYVESEDCFAVKTILSGWYKLTPEFVDNNVREEIKPLPLIEKNRQLREENTELKRVLEIVNNTCVDIGLLKRSENWLDYYTRYKYRTGKNTKLTEEEFDLLKKILGQTQI